MRFCCNVMHGKAPLLSRKHGQPQVGLEDVCASEKHISTKTFFGGLLHKESLSPRSLKALGIRGSEPNILGVYEARQFFIDQI